MTKTKEKIYTYVNGNFKLVTEEKPKFNGYGENEKRYTTQIDEAQDFFLSKSPFLYSTLTCPYKIKTIEEYYCFVKNKKIVFRDVVRDPSMATSKKKRIINKTFQRWEKTYSKEINNNLNDTERTLASVDKVNIEPLDIRYNIFLIFIAFIVAILTYTNSLMWYAFKRSGFGDKLYRFIVQGIINAPWIQIVGEITLILILLCYIFTLLYNGVSYTFKNKFTYSKGALQSSNKKSKKKQRKDFKKARKYYLKNASKAKKKMYFTPLPIEKVSIHSGEVTKFEMYQTSLKNTVIKCQKQRNIVVAINRVFVVVVTLGWVTIVGYFIYAIVRKLLF